VQIPADASGITRNGRQPRDAGEPVYGVERVHVAADVRQESCCKYGAEPRHAQQNISAFVLPEQLGDLGIDVSDLCIKSADLFGQPDDQGAEPVV
jgi:hypothetical protein